MFDMDPNYYIKKLKNTSLPDISGIEYRYTYGYMRSPSFSDTIFLTNGLPIIVRNFGKKLFETLNTAQKLDFNKFDFHILDNPSNNDISPGFDKVICNKTQEFEFEVIYNKPDIHRVISPLGKSPIVGLISLFLIVISGYSIYLLMPLILSDKLFGKSFGGNLILIFIVMMIILLFFLFVYIFVDYCWFEYGISREKKTFNVQKLTPAEYPIIHITNNYFSYVRRGIQREITWDKIAALYTSWGKTMVYLNDGDELPIPTYELISVFSNDIIVSNIIECAGLTKKGSNLWVDCIIKNGH